jgi:integrase
MPVALRRYSGIDDVWCIKFAPEAGSLKTSGSERVVPVHPALLESGLLSYVSQVRSGPLFAELSPDKFDKRGGNGTKMIGRFVRQLGLKDPRLSPSHSWRHRIKTLGRKHALAQDILNAITRHGSKSVVFRHGIRALTHMWNGPGCKIFLWLNKG